MKRIFTLLLILATTWSFAQVNLRTERSNTSKTKSGVSENLDFSAEQREAGDLFGGGNHTPSLKSDETVVWEEGFEDWDPDSPGLLPEGWMVYRTSTLDATPTDQPETGRWVANNPDSNPFGGADNENPDAWEDYVNTGEGSMIIGYTAPDFTWAVSPEMTLPHGTFELEFWTWYINVGGAGPYPTNYHVAVWADGEWNVELSQIGEADENTNNAWDEAVVVDLDAYAGHVIRVAFIYEYTDGYQMAIDDVVVKGIEEELDTYTITFNVDMTDVEGFDPAEDKVFLTGTLTEWAEPGSVNSIELTRKVDAKSAHVIFEDNFEDGTLDAWGEIIEGDGVYGDDDDGLAHWHVRDWDQTGDPLEGQTKIMRCSWGFDIDTWAITPLIEDLPADAVFSFWYNASYHWNVDPNPNGLLTVKVSTDGGDNWDVIWNWQEIGVWENWQWYHVELPLDDYIGENIHVAFHMLADDNGTTTIDLVSLYVAEEVDEVFFTATVEGVEAGELQYKYFSDAFGDGWDGGEWAGEPNRSVIISGDVTLDDVWGDQPSSIVENELTVQGINLFPNPVRNTLYVENTDRINQIRIFDLTGRMVYNQMVNDNTTSVNVSEFTKGVYIMQVMTVGGVTSKKFNVVK